MINNEEIIRAWKDVDYRNTLREEQLSQVPDHPAGLTEITDEEMKNIAGGRLTRRIRSKVIRVATKCGIDYLF